MSADRTLRVGVDVVSVDSVLASVERFGHRYLDRLFTDHEQQACAGPPRRRAESLAARFAAKEATVKALRLADGPGDWRAIEVRRRPGGWPELVLTGAPAEAAARAGVDDLAVSLSHEGDTAVAMVMCTASGGAPERGAAGEY
ncbi:MAG TPA: holo-ACP synthase [Angustibacter sp.]|nr:holo-ACP synthase [Angustibacter sp.]